MRVRVLLAAVSLFAWAGCGTSVHDLCLDECNKLNACGAESGQGDCSAQCPDLGIEVTSTSACKDIGGADDCINAVTPSSDTATCVSQVSDCLSRC